MVWHTNHLGTTVLRIVADGSPLACAPLIRPKRIYNFCLFHDLLGDIIICFATLLYHFTHIWTNIITQCTQCQFLSADVYFAGASGSPKEGQRWRRGLPGGLLARPGPRSRQEVAWVGPTSSGALLWPIFRVLRGNPRRLSGIANFSIVSPPQRF